MKIENLSADLKPLREKISGLIRDSIIEGKIKPGQRLTEPEIASSLGVSRTPIREAFLQLESDGFVKVQPRKGAIVTELSLKDAEETYVIKGVLEALAAGLATEYISENEIENLIKLNQQLDKIASSELKNYKRFLDLNAKFHLTLYEHSGNNKLIKTIKTLRNQTLRYNYIYLSLHSHLDESVKEHFKIIELIKIHDSKEVEKMIKIHGEAARIALYDFIKSNIY